MSQEARSLEEVFGGVIATIFAKLMTSRPARVERYDETLQQVDVRPLFQESYQNADGDRVLESPPLVQNVPLAWPGASGGFLSFGLDVGDTVGLVYFDRSSDRWKSLGDEVDPVDVRRHHPSDAWAIPGLHAFNAPLAGVSKTDAVLQVRAGAQLLLGGPSATDAAARASIVEAKLAALAAVFTSFVPVTADGIAIKTAITTLVGTPWPGSVGSSVVKVTP